LIGIDDAKRGPSQYFHFASNISRLPSKMISAPSTGFTPKPTSAAFTETNDIKNKTNIFITARYGGNPSCISDKETDRNRDFQIATS
jgi:hypothetical protein